MKKHFRITRRDNTYYYHKVIGRKLLTIAACKDSLTKISSLCDGDNPTHEHIWHIANDTLKLIKP